MSNRNLGIALSSALLVICPALSADEPEPGAAPLQQETGNVQPAGDTGETVAKSTIGQAHLVGLPVLGLHNRMIGTVDNVVLGRPDGDFVIIRIDRGLLPGTRLVGVYKRMIKMIESESGTALWLPKYRLDDLRKFESFQYADDMQLAAPRS